MSRHSVKAVLVLMLVCCHTFSLLTYAARVKSLPYKIPSALSLLSVTSTGGVAIYKRKGTRIFPQGRTLCSLEETGVTYCQGEDSMTRVSLAGSPHVHIVTVEAYAKTHIKNASGICEISTSENNHTSLNCTLSTDNSLPGFPHLNVSVRKNATQSKEQGVCNTLSEVESSEHDNASEELQTQSTECKLPNPLQTQTLIVTSYKNHPDSPLTQNHSCHQTKKKQSKSYDLSGYTQAFSRSARHKRPCSREKCFICNWPGCYQTFTQSGSLTTHKRIHTGERPYVCTWRHCTRAFTQQSNLVRHMRIHTKSNPYICDWPDCNSAFNQSNNLIRHMRVHTNERPYRCDQPDCTQAFTQLNNLKKHKSTHFRNKHD